MSERTKKRRGDVAEELSLLREIEWYDAFCMSYADVGADIYIALGVTALFAAGGTPLAFLVGSLLYMTIGLAYAELASSYPLAGGAQVFAMRAFNDAVGFVAGWMLMLDYILDISLFTVAAAGYLGFIFPQLSSFLKLGPLNLPLLGLAALSLSGMLMLINYLGIKPSAKFTTLLVTVNLVVTFFILISGYLGAWSLGTFLSNLSPLGTAEKYGEVAYSGILSVRTENFLYGLTLAMASFIGIETVAQTAEEVRNPARTVPKAATLAIVMVVLGVMGYSALGLGSLGWAGLAEAQLNPIAAIASRIPVIGYYVSGVVALVGFLITVASANTGVIGISRLAYSMGKFMLLPRTFSRVHPRFRTPTRPIIIFTLLAMLITLWGMLQPNMLVFIASLYNFGALLSYIIVLSSLMILRNVDRRAYRPFRMPINLNLRFRGRRIEIPVLALIGLVGVSCIWGLVIVYHYYVRWLGGLWIGLGLLLYAIFRRRSKLPLRAALGRELVNRRPVDFS